MRIFVTTGRKATLAAVAVLVAAGAGGTAYAATGSGGPASPPSGSTGSPAPAPHAHAHGRPRSLLQRSDHAVLEIKVKGQWVTYDFDRGRVTAVSPTSITLARPDGQSVTDSIDPATRYGGVTSEAAIRMGRPATVVSVGGAALRIHQGPPPAGQAAAPAS